MFDASRPRAPRFILSLRRRATRAGALAVLAALATVGGMHSAAPASATASPITLANGIPTGPSVLGFGDALANETAVDLVADDGGLLTSNAALKGTLVIANRTSQEVAAGAVAITVEQAPYANRQALTQADQSAAASGTELIRVTTPAVPAGGRVEIPFEVAATSLPFTPTSAVGAYGLHASWLVDDETTARGQTTVVWTSDTAAAPKISTIVPVVAPLGSDTLLTASELEALTQDGGALDQLLDAVEGHLVTLAIDPRLIASIRALGTDAPASARNWLVRLTESEHDSFPLAFADANPTLFTQSELSEPLVPTGFHFVSDAHAFTSDPTESASAEPSASADPGATATTAPPTPTGTAPGETTGAPSVNDLTEFDYTRDGLAWPLRGTIAAADLPTLASWSPSGIVVASSQLSGSPSCAPVAQVGGTSALVTDSTLTDLAADAVFAEDALGRSDAVSTLTSMVAATTTGNTATDCHLVVALPRIALDDPANVAPLLDALDQVGLSTLSELPAVEGGPPAELLPGAVAASQLERYRALLDAEPVGVTYAHLFDNATGAVDQLRVELIRLASASWALSTQNWQSAAASYLDRTTGTPTKITVANGSEVQLIGHQISLPVFIENESDYRVTVVVTLHPTTGHLDILEPTTITLEPHTNARAQVPVEAIANGITQVVVTLTTTDGVDLPSSGRIAVNINAEIETVIMWLLVGSVVLLFGFGVFRTIRRRNRTAGRARIRAEVTQSTTSTDEPSLESATDTASTTTKS
ncbi:hypothetical protein EG850_07710 [Gulosibacter macacae]|uniref:Secreted protein n=1 Tax=Gulosibacter macacae TaxID=2488791 RepID=A0A3P3VYL6_9MICO|nr:DUF6049 family protein [Gulosibacter macacae]RRJ86529.1 hypothetical protein EG850_07710 [Gulosibacter macacae]